MTIRAQLAYHLSYDNGDVSEDLEYHAALLRKAKQVIMRQYGDDVRCVVGLEELGHIGVEMESQREVNLESAIELFVEHTRIPDIIRTKKSLYSKLEGYVLKRAGKKFSRNPFYGFFTGGRVVVDI